MAVAGSYAYVVDGYTSLRILNIANPVAPIEVGFHHPEGSYSRVASAGNLVYVIDEGFDFYTGRLDIINVSDPTAPTVTGFYPINDIAQDVTVAGAYVYITVGGSLLILDIANPAAPAEAGIYLTSGSRYSYDVTVTDNYAYITGEGGLRIIDIANPAASTQVGFYDTPLSSYDVTVVEDNAYVVGSGGLRIVNINDPSLPQSIGFLERPSLYQDVVVLGKHAYVAEDADGNFFRSYGGLRIINVANPTTPIETGFFETEWAARGVAVAGNYAYVTEDYGGLRIINIADPAAPAEVGFYDISGYVYELVVAGNYAYVAGGDKGLRIINVANPVAPTEIDFLTSGWAYDVAVAGSYAYVADGGGGLRIINVANPSAPTEVGFYNTPGGASDVAVAGSYAYVANSDGLRIIDVANPAAPADVGHYYTPVGAIDVAVAGNYVYVADGEGGLFILKFTSDSQTTYSISGKVTMQDDTPLQGVVVSASFGKKGTTDANGNYTINGLPAGAYDVGATQSGFTFAPINTTVPPSKDNVNLVGVSEYDFDTGFRPRPNGYSFFNGDSGWGIWPFHPADGDFTTLDMQRMFGDDRVCLISGTPGQPCIAFHALAKLWHAQVNSVGTWGGHCTGMAATSLRFFQDPGRLLGSFNSTYDLSLSNARRDITYFHVMQWAEPIKSIVTHQQEHSTPKITLAELKTAFDVSEEVVLLMKYGTEGHSVTPYALDDKGNGIWHVRIYDNNGPGRGDLYVVIDELHNTWRYDPKQWSGDASSHSLFVVSLDNFNGPQHPPAFWNAQTRSQNDEVANLAQIWLSGNGHLLISDTEGRQVGFREEQLVNEIPNANVLTVFGGVAAVEPVYEVPSDETYTIQLNGINARSSEFASIVQFGPGYGVSVNNIPVDTTGDDELVVSSDGAVVTYKASGQAEPDLRLVFDEGAASQQFEILGADLGKGQTISVQADLVDKWLLFDSENAKGGAYNLAMTVADTSVEHQFSYENIQINSGDTHYIDFLELEGGGPVYLGIDIGSDGTLDDYYELGEPTSGDIYLPVTLRPSSTSSQPPLSFVYPQSGQTLNFEGDYLFKVIPYPNAEGYLWGFFQNGQYVWENMTEEGTLDGHEYEILSGHLAT